MQKETKENIKWHFLGNLAQIFAQISFGISAVIGELGLPTVNPVLFALVREGVAGPILCLVAIVVSRKYQKPLLPTKDMRWRLFVCGIAMFVNQFCSITGMKLAGGVTQSIWQPTQPIFTLILAIFLGFEKPTILKILGILMSFAGVSFMVLYGADSNTSNYSLGSQIGGNIMFFFNCFGTSVYIVVSKPLLSQIHSVAVTGIAYLIASILMLIACVVVTTTPTLLRFVCPQLNNQIKSGGCGNGWTIPSEAFFALSYFIFFTSIFSYSLITWGNKFVPSSTVSAYTVLQPVVTTFVTYMIILVTEPPHYNLKGPNYGDFGVLAIFLGLSMVIHDSKTQPQIKEIEIQPILSQKTSSEL
eukprot:c4203_g1_i1.p1 GENE.c4203_g1_i1~~c4203_g1_i1.p1  ORF type:complete len:359 (+),score=107.34 c4203_g1_i1:40-1116(+)